MTSGQILLDNDEVAQTVAIVDQAGYNAFGGSRPTITGTFSSAHPAIIDGATLGIPVGVNVVPGSGDTVLVETSLTEDAFSNPNSAHWTNWDAGAVTVATAANLIGKVKALRFTVTAGSTASVYELLA